METQKNTAQQFISNEMEVRMKVIETPGFIEMAIEAAKQLGITAKEWNENKSMILMMFANEIIGIDNKNNQEIRTALNK
jgi:hypothetical protein